jgi:hypothetical protein
MKCIILERLLYWTWLQQVLLQLHIHDACCTKFICTATIQVFNTSTDVTPATSPLDPPAHGKGISDTVLRKLQSVERHFGSQNLQTPQPEGGLSSVLNAGS